MDKDIKRVESIINRTYRISQFNNFVKSFEEDICADKKNNDFDKWLREYIQIMKNKCSQIEAETIYRCRILEEEDLISERNGINIENLSGYDCLNSKEPPSAAAANGRCNSKGNSYFYAAEDEYTALVEIRPVVMQFVSLAEFEIYSLLLADLTLCYLQDDRSKYYAKKLFDIFSFIKVKEESYRISQYVASLFRENGFDGIRYPSSLTAGNNIVIFNYLHKNMRFVKSRLVRLFQVEFEFADISKNKLIEKNLKTGYTEQSCSETIQLLNKMKKISVENKRS